MTDFGGAGVAWYHDSDYEELRALFEDGDGMFPTYNEWLQTAQTRVEQLKREGVRVEKIHLKPAEFVDWCSARGLKLNGEARSQYAAETLALRDTLD